MKTTVERANEGKVEGILSVKETIFNPEMSEAESGDKGLLTLGDKGLNSHHKQTTTVISLDHERFTDVAFLRCLSFLYTGTVDLDKESGHLDETISAAHLFNLPELVLICENAKKGEEFLNPSIGTWLNDRNSAISKEIFLNKNLFSDVCFRVEGTLVPAHKLVLCSRCDVLSAMLTGRFRESQSNEIEIIGFSLESFLAFLEYLYTDHSPIEESDSVGIMELSNHYVMSRLMALCELYISKEVERATANSISKADIDIIGLLLTSQLHNAAQLDSWCLHFVSSNYLAFHEQDAFSLIQGNNLDHVTRHRWPPLSYEEEIEAYRKKYLDEEGEKEEEEGGKEEGEDRKERRKRFKFLRFLKNF